MMVNGVGSVIFTPEAPAPGGAYSQGRCANGLVFTSGFGGFDPHSRVLVSDNVGGQTRQALRNIEAVLGARKVALRDVVKVNAYLQEPLRDFAEFNAVYREFFSEPLPVRTTVGCKLLNMLVEIDVVAVAAEGKDARRVSG